MLYRILPYKIEYDKFELIRYGNNYARDRHSHIIEDIDSFSEILKAIDFDGFCLEKDGKFNIYRHTDHDSDMICKEEYCYLLAMPSDNNSKYIFSDLEKIMLLREYLKLDDHYKNVKITIKTKEQINDIVFCKGGFFSRFMHNNLEDFCYHKDNKDFQKLIIDNE